MSSVLGLIDVRGTFLFHQKDEGLNRELAECLKNLKEQYDVHFHLCTADTSRSFNNHPKMGIPAFWNNYADISGLDKEAVLYDGIFDISKVEPSKIKIENYFGPYNKGDTGLYPSLAGHYGTPLDNMFLLDDSYNNLSGAKNANVTAIDSTRDDYLEKVTNFVKTHATPKMQ